MGDPRRFAPAGWNERWDSMPNAVRALYIKVRLKWFRWAVIEIRVEAWGQLCFDEAAASAAANHMWNHGMRAGWEYVSWRVEMDGPLVGDAKMSGLAPADFSLAKYGPPCASASIL